MEEKRLLTRLLQVDREQGGERRVAWTLRRLSDANRQLGLFGERIQRAQESLEIQKRLDDAVGQAWCFNNLAFLLYDDGQLDAAEEATVATLELLEKGEELLVCQSHHLLGNIYYSKGEKWRAIRQFQMAFRIASPFNWHAELFWIQHSLAQVFLDEGWLDDAHVYIERAKSHAVNDSTYCLGRVVLLHARVFLEQRKFEEAGSQALRALEMFEKLGAVSDRDICRGVHQRIEESTKGQVAPGECPNLWK